VKISILSLALSAMFAFPLCAQIVPFESGVAMGHYHLNAKDPATAKDFWVAMLGGTAVKPVGNNEIVKFPGVLVFIKKGDPTGGTVGSSVNHIGFTVRDLPGYRQKLQAAGFQVDDNANGVQFMFNGPDQVRIELSENKTQEAPIMHHHVHFYSMSVDDTKAWYVKTFDAKPGRRGKFEAADIPGANLSFSLATAVPAPTKGRALDHIGFEVKGLEPFCKKLEAGGVKFDVPYRKIPNARLAIAFFTDPFGTYVELTEGLTQY
jgi:catechol 2,3-dioxygenase-like lactoylglutathione lyase family enzyme